MRPDHSWTFHGFMRLDITYCQQAHARAAKGTAICSARAEGFVDHTTRSKAVGAFCLNILRLACASSTSVSACHALGGIAAVRVNGAAKQTKCAVEDIKSR